MHLGSLAAWLYGEEEEATAAAWIIAMDTLSYSYRLAIGVMGMPHHQQQFHGVEIHADRSEAGRYYWRLVGISCDAL